MDSVTFPLRIAWSSSRWLLSAYLLASCLSALAPAAIAWALKMTVDAAADPALGGPSVVQFILLLGVLTLLSAVLSNVRAFAANEVRRGVGIRAQDLLYRAMERLRGLGSLESPTFQNRLSVAQGSATSAAGQVVLNAVDTAASLVTIASLAVALLSIHWFAAATLVAAALPILRIELALAKRQADMAWALSPVERREIFYSSLLSHVDVAKEIRLFGLGSFFRGRMLSERAQANRTYRAHDARELRAQALSSSISLGLSTVVLVWAATRVASGAFSIGELTMLIALTTAFQGALSSLAGLIAGSHQFTLLLSHLRQVLDTRCDLATLGSPERPARLQRGIEFRNVWFRYGPDQPWTLQDVSVFLPHGRLTGIVGRNGSGKSTLIKLLCRFYDPDRGAIFWDGKDIRSLDLDELRDRMSVIFQDFVQYDLSVADNIGVGDVSSISERTAIELAAVTSGAHEAIVRLPFGYDTILSRMFHMNPEKEDPQSGVLLSGGQWRRVALARALIRRHRDVLILDEPVSGLDAIAEQEVNSTVREYRLHTTSLIVTHRLGALREADQIVVLAGGRVAECGTHQQLIQADGPYAALFAAQADQYLPRIEVEHA